ncbi:hypothetical protein X943_003195 [Babesia divergens]|uniref:Rab-GAP TBC domain-containing protein n=1 Tax=Babesia divergens TaxID=32595 RepID=A0AAD9G901_BABDI|nr:hypothetical protein X943_003195 [Babesia divergens]
MVRINTKRRPYMPPLAARGIRHQRFVAKHPRTQTHKGKRRHKPLEQPDENNHAIDGAENDADRCNCGCGRQLRRMLSLLLQRFFASKRRWMKSLKVSKWRPQELARISEVIEENGHDAFAAKALDLDIIQLDVSRQQWLTNEENANLVRRALVTFCVVNNVGYWQGLHDVAAALVYITPKPSVGELAAMLEKLVLNFASILLRRTDENIVNDAAKISAKWRLMFQFFFPRAATELEKLSDFNSWNINWFLTMGFYRFGCAHIVLAYVYTIILCSAGCMTAFMYQELGYLGIRGHMKWLLDKNVECKHFTNNLFDDHLDEALLSKALTNSKMVHLDAEELINVSRNLYDTLNDVDCEVADFPLVAILKFSSFFFNKSPLGLYKNNDVQLKTVVQMGIADIFKGHETHRPMECQSTQSQVIPRGREKRAARSVANMKISEALNDELINIYLKNMYANVRKKSFIFPSRFAGGIAQKGLFYYHVVDVRSDYLKYGEPLQTFFGNDAVAYINEDEIDDVIKDSNFAPIFTIWVIVTDDGYDNPSDATSLESLDRGVDLYRILARSFSGVALLKGGYNALLRWKNLPTPSRFNITFLKKFLDWIPAAREQATKISIENVLDTVEDTFRDTSGRFGYDVPTGIDIFRKDTHPYDLGKSCAIDQEAIRADPCSRYAIYILVGNNMSVEVNSEGGIKVNGIIWHPHIIARCKTNIAPSFLMHVVTLFQVAKVDGFLEIVTKGTAVPGASNILKRQMSDFQECITTHAILLRENHWGECSPVPTQGLKLVTKLATACKYSTQKPFVKQWTLDSISIIRLTGLLISAEMLMKTHLTIAANQYSPKNGHGGVEHDFGEETPDYADISGDEFISEHPFRVPMEKVIEMLDARNMQNKHGMQLESGRLKTFASMTTANADARHGSACSERKVHVFSRRSKAHTRGIDTTHTPNPPNTKQTNAANSTKNVFIPRNQIKKTQNA